MTTVAHATNQNSTEQYRDAARPSQAPNSAKLMRVAGRATQHAQRGRREQRARQRGPLPQVVLYVNLMTGNSEARSTYCVNTFGVECKCAASRPPSMPSAATASSKLVDGPAAARP